MTRPLEALDVPPIQKFLEKQRASSENTFQLRRSDVLNSHDWLSDKDLELADVTACAIDDYLTEQMAAGYGPKTVQARFYSLRELFKFLSPFDIVIENPFNSDEIQRRNYTQPNKRKLAEADGIQFVSTHEVDLLVKHVLNPKLRNKVLIQLMFQTGIRTSEVTRIRLKDLHRDKRAIDVYSEETGDTRTVYYQDSLDYFMTEWLDHGYRVSFPDAAKSGYLLLTHMKGRIPDRPITLS